MTLRPLPKKPRELEHLAAKTPHHIDTELFKHRSDLEETINYNKGVRDLYQQPTSKMTPEEQMDAYVATMDLMANYHILMNARIGLMLNQLTMVTASEEHVQTQVAVTMLQMSVASGAAAHQPGMGLFKQIVGVSQMINHVRNFKLYIDHQMATSAESWMMYAIPVRQLEIAIAHKISEDDSSTYGDAVATISPLATYYMGVTAHHWVLSAMLALREFSLTQMKTMLSHQIMQAAAAIIPPVQPEMTPVNPGAGAPAFIELDPQPMPPTEEPQATRAPQPQVQPQPAHPFMNPIAMMMGMYKSPQMRMMSLYMDLMMAYVHVQASGILYTNYVVQGQILDEKRPPSPERLTKMEAYSHSVPTLVYNLLGGSFAPMALMKGNIDRMGAILDIQEMMMGAHMGINPAPKHDEAQVLSQVFESFVPDNHPIIDQTREQVQLAQLNAQTSQDVGSSEEMVGAN